MKAIERVGEESSIKQRDYSLPSEVYCFHDMSVSSSSIQYLPDSTIRRNT